MKKNLLTKIRNRKGFTLAELLIVVAIIGVLVAVSIPIFTSQLEKAREATDVANMRAAKAEASADYLSADLDTSVWTVTEASHTATAYYDAASGKMVKDAPIVKYGKGTNADGHTSYTGYTNTTDYTNAVIKVTVDTEKGDITVDWKGAKAKG
ncbi:MAG: prepilin-type N-terminal cleavage/methylation domain-containing protein [Bilifractor sp.]|nr:prepilin-type N-terminal cleavage/methylation domain-containing protein [Bilifractor sp.]